MKSEIAAFHSQQGSRNSSLERLVGREAVAEILAYVYELTGKNLGPQPVPAG